MHELVQRLMTNESFVFCVRCSRPLFFSGDRLNFSAALWHQPRAADECLTGRSGYVQQGSCHAELWWASERCLIISHPNSCPGAKSQRIADNWCNTCVILPFETSNSSLWTKSCLSILNRNLRPLTKLHLQPLPVCTFSSMTTFQFPKSDLQGRRQGSSLVKSHGRSLQPRGKSHFAGGATEIRNTQRNTPGWLILFFAAGEMFVCRLLIRVKQKETMCWLQQIWGQQTKRLLLCCRAADGGDRWVESHGKDLVNR